VWKIWKIGFQFEPRDLWVGVFWDRRWTIRPAPGEQYDTRHYDSIWVYVCLVPMLPFRLALVWEEDYSV
jgi:hypothetical protein